MEYLRVITFAFFISSFCYIAFKAHTYDSVKREKT